MSTIHTSNRVSPDFAVGVRTAETSVLRVRNVSKSFRRRGGSEVKAIVDVSFDVNAGEVLVLLGPSGCGKTTLLRCIAGLEDPDGGHIEVQERTVFQSEQRVNVRAENRKLSMVFQSYALWPHMTVANNIAYPLHSLPRSVRPSRSEIAERVDAIMETVGIAGLQKQFPNAISGGQQQRVALSRALIANSKLVLFDEPLSNIDAQVRERLREELLEMQRELKFAAVFVTHDRQEAMVLGHRIAVLNGGKIRQIDSPRRVYANPADHFVARFIGPTNDVVVKAVTRGDDGYASATTPIGGIRGRVAGELDGIEATAVWRPEAATLSDAEPGIANRWLGAVELVNYYGAQVEYIVRIGDHRMRVLDDGDSAREIGSLCWVSVEPQHVYFLARA